MSARVALFFSGAFAFGFTGCEEAGSDEDQSALDAGDPRPEDVAEGPAREPGSADTSPSQSSAPEPAPERTRPVDGGGAAPDGSSDTGSLGSAVGGSTAAGGARNDDPVTNEGGDSSQGVDAGVSGAPVDAGRSGVGGNAADDDLIVEPTSEGVPDDYLVFGSGSRLQATYYQAEGAPPVFAGFYDTLLDGPCRLGEMSGVHYCVPTHNWQLTQRGYADALCSRRVYEAPACVPSEFYNTSSQPPCYDLAIRRVSAPMESFVAYELDDTGDCVVQSEPLPASAELRVESELTTPSGLVRGLERVLPANGALTLGLLEMEDGAFAPSRVVDAQFGYACGSLLDADPLLESASCSFGSATLSSASYRDAACLEPVGVGFDSTPFSCGNTDVVRRSSSSNEPDEPRIYHAAGDYEGPLWQISADECVALPEPASPGNSFPIALGDPLPEAEIPTVLGTLVGDGRLRVQRLSDGDTPLFLRTTDFWDPVPYESCLPAPVQGELRCIGGNREGFWEAVRQYADAACGEPLGYCTRGPYCREIYWYERTENTDCTTDAQFTNLRRLVAEVSDPVYELDGAGDCVGPVTAEGAWTWELIDPDTLPLVELLALP